LPGAGRAGSSAPASAFTARRSANALDSVAERSACSDDKLVKIRNAVLTGDADHEMLLKNFGLLLRETPQRITLDHVLRIMGTMRCE
jgi:hypothetical protein